MWWKVTNKVTGEAYEVEAVNKYSLLEDYDISEEYFIVEPIERCATVAYV